MVPVGVKDRDKRCPPGGHVVSRLVTGPGQKANLFIPPYVSRFGNRDKNPLRAGTKRPVSTSVATCLIKPKPDPLTDPVASPRACPCSERSIYIYFNQITVRWTPRMH